MGGRALALVVPRADEQHVADDDPAAARAPAGLQHHRARQVAPGSRHVHVGGAQPEGARVAVEHRAEHAGRVHPRQAHPLDVPAGRHQRRGLAVRQEAVVGDRGKRAGPNRTIGAELRHPTAPRRDAAAGSISNVRTPSLGPHQAGRGIGTGRVAERARHRLRLVFSRDQEHHLASRIQDRERKGHAGHERSHSRRLDPHRPAPALGERPAAREQRGGVRVRPEPQQQQVQARRPVAEGGAQALLVGQGGRLEAQLALDPVHRGRLATDVVQEALLGHEVVRVLVVRSHGAVVSEPQLHARPVQLHRRQALMRRPGRRAARQRDVPAGANGLRHPLGGGARHVVQDLRPALAHPRAGHDTIASAALSAGP